MDLCLDSMISILKDNRYGLSFRDIKSNFDNEDKEIKTVIESGELFNLIKRLGEGRSTRYYDFNVDAILPNSNTANKEIQKFSDLTGKKKIEENYFVADSSNGCTIIRHTTTYRFRG